MSLKSASSESDSLDCIGHIIRKLRGDDPNAQEKINKGEPDEMEIDGFVFSPIKLFMSILIVILTGGLFLILLTWRSDIKLNCMYQKVELRNANKILLKDKFHQIFEEDVVQNKKPMKVVKHEAAAGGIEDFERNLHFVNKKIKYVWNPNVQKYCKLTNIDDHMKQSEFHKAREGLNDAVVADRIEEYGTNFIKISVPPILYLVVHEALNPFYLFQAYTVILWSVQLYWKFAVIIAITSVISVTASVWETRRQNRNLRDKMKSESTIVVLRNGSAIEKSSKELVPGDVLLLPTSGGYMMECDAVLIEGTCVVNESMLTGESIPITKISVSDENAPFKYDLQRQHVVFSGTEILQGKAQTGDYCKSVVIRTGFMTTKGELVRSILFPPPLDFQFHRDFLKSIYVFLSLGMIGMSYSLYMWIRNGGTTAEIILNSLDILTFVVPPILPAALTANNAFAQRRLEKQGIFCLHSKHISLCGGIDIVAFDKTGTLTEGNLDLAGVSETRGAPAPQFMDIVADPTTLPLDSSIVHCMACCHSLIHLNGELTGNPLDVKLFEAIEWDMKEQFNVGVNPDYGVPTPTLVSPPKGPRHGGHFKSAPSNLEIACLKTYPFDSAVQRMTVIAKKKGAPHFDVFVKGAPEKVASLCKPETIPTDFANVLQIYTKQGLRVIAAATKSLNANARWREVDEMSRSELEEKCEFLGLIVMQNLVKKETYPAIEKLHGADIESVMVTGDNILTAISVAHDCKLIRPGTTIIKVDADLIQDSYSSRLNVSYTIQENEKDGEGSSFFSGPNYAFACDGRTFGLIRNNDKRLLDSIVQKGKVFARMLPEQKIHLIECMKDLGRQVIMCGDGCNDCGALKAAHAGISLSMAEASVAAPFTSKNVHIACVPYLIREGRATIVSAFSAYKFGVVFGFTQLIAVLMVFYIGTEPSDNQYLVMDIGLAALPSVMIGNNGPHSTLIKQKPTRHLLSFLPLFSVISFLLFQTLCYVGVWFYVQSQNWFEPYVFEAGVWPPNASYEQTNIFLLSCAAAVIGAIVFAKGAPYRTPIFKNGIMCAWTVAAVATTVFMCIYDTEDFRERLNMKIAPTLEYKLVLVFIMVANFLFCYIWEVFFLDGILFAKILPWYKEHIRGPHLPFEHLEEELKCKPGWPPIGNCKNNDTKIVMERDGKSSGNANVVDQQTQTPGDGVSITFRSQLKNATRNIKNRWSSSGADAATGIMTGSTEESQSLLSGAGDLLHETPTHLQQQQQPPKPLDRMNRNIHHQDSIPSIPPPPYPPATSSPALPPTSQLQRAINHTLRTSTESNMLSTPDPLLSSVTDRTETIC